MFGDFNIANKSEPTIAHLLGRAGLRSTRAREIVLHALNRAGRPLSHQEIASESETRRLDRVTLYRTLTTLQEAGLLHRIQGIDGVWRFSGHRAEPDKCGGNHIHFLCVTCHRMSCLPEQPLPWVREPGGSEVFGKQLVVYGRCAVCVSKVRDKAPAETKAARIVKKPKTCSQQRKRGENR